MSEDEKDGKGEKPFFVTRFLAFLLDGFIVLLLASLIAMPFIDSDKLISMSNESKQIVEKYQSKDITDKEYSVEIVNIEYMMARGTVLVSIISILVGLLYYVVLPLYNKGQTLGKKLFGMRIVSTSGNLDSNKLLFRALIADFLLLNIISVLFIMFASREVYFGCVEIFTFIQYLITAISIIMIIVDKKGLAIHDSLVHTKVIKNN